MSVTIKLEAKAVQGQEEHVKQILLASMADTRAFEGCISVSIHEELDTPGSIMFHQNWKSKEAYEKYFAWRSKSREMATILPLLAVPPHITLYRNLDI